MRTPSQQAIHPAVESAPVQDGSLWQRLWTELRPRRASGYLLGGLLLTIFLIVYIWWPLAEEYLAYVDWNGPWWRYIDWLLINIFAVMSLLIIAGAELRYDARVVFVGLIGGLVIEAWGTQTSLWTYYTNERPPLWIIPAWPVASLAIDRLVRILDVIVPKERGNLSLRATPQRQALFDQAETGHCEEGALCTTKQSPRWPGDCHASLAVTGQFLKRSGKAVLRIATEAIAAPAGYYRSLYWLVFGAFFALMLHFTAPTFDRSLTVASLVLVAFIILTPTDQRRSLLIFAAGAGLGYYLELWGTTRECWTYYTLQTPPLFAVLAHGMAALAFWRAQLILESLSDRLFKRSPALIRKPTGSKFSPPRANRH